MLAFLFGMFTGAFIGFFAALAITVGKTTDLMDENYMLKDELHRIESSNSNSVNITKGGESDVRSKAENI